MEEELKQYLGKKIKLHLGTEWKFFGQLVAVVPEKDLVRMIHEETDIVLKLSAITGITHVRGFTDRTCPPADSAYHPRRVQY